MVKLQYIRVVVLDMSTLKGTEIPLCLGMHHSLLSHNIYSSICPYIHQS